MRIPCDPDLVEEMKGMIDPTDFRTVKAYFRDPKSEIQGVLLVQEGYRLEEVAAFFASPDEETKEAVFHQMLEERVILAGVDDFRAVRPAADASAVLLDSIPDDRLCYVIYLPPLYLVRVTDRKLE